MSAFRDWIGRFRSEALRAGIHATTYDSAMTGLAPDPRVIAADSKQPEFTRPIWEYLDSALAELRYTMGRDRLAANEALFSEIEQAYGVDREVVAAIWGLESGYGGFMGKYSVVRSLSTLAFEGRRQDYGSSQLLAALKIIQNGDIEPEVMTGSWAGAMGQTQFIPTTYLGFAVDHDGDGRRDIWTNLADVFASTANYLKASGWRLGAPWGHEVTLPEGFDYALADPKKERGLDVWRALGVTLVDGTPLPDEEDWAVMIMPAGHSGPVFLLRKNFKVIMTYNNSTSYALAVAKLSDRFRGLAPIQTPWPRHQEQLSRADREDLQTRLTAKGFDTGGIDGMIGPNTRNAVRAYQKLLGWPADGHPTLELLQRLRQG